MDLPLHPMIVHLPIALALLMPLLTGGLLLAVWREWLPKRSWLLASLGQLLLVGSGWLALSTGEADEERVENRVPEAVLERHEEAAERFVWGGVLVLALASLPLLLSGRRAARVAMACGVAGTVAVLFLAYDVGHKGGELVYGHLVGNAAAGAGSGPAMAVGRKQDADDDH